MKRSKVRQTNKFTGCRERLRPYGVKFIGGTSDFKDSEQTSLSDTSADN